MRQRLLPVQSEEFDEGEWLEPDEGYPIVPGPSENKELVRLEKKTRAAMLYLKYVPVAVEMGRRENEATGGTNFLRIYASPRRIVIQQRTPVFKWLEDEICVDMPDIGQWD